MAGSAWTNQVVSQVLIAGTVPGVLAYSPVIASGDLIASVSGSQTTDGPGNEVLAGVTGYSHIGGTWYATQLGGTGLAAATAFYTAPAASGPYTLQGFIEGSPSGMTINSSSSLVLGTGGASQAVVIGQSSGLTGGVPVTQLDRTVLATTGGSASAADITNTWTIPAHDADNGAKYTIETHVTATTGQTTIETLTLGLDLNAGTLVPLATLGTAFNGGALSTTYEIPVRLTVVPGAGTSAGNAQIVLSASLADSSVNRLSTNSANMGGRSDTTAFTTTASNTVALYAQWGGAGGSQQTAGTRWSEFVRSGQN